MSKLGRTFLLLGVGSLAASAPACFFLNAIKASDEGSAGFFIAGLCLIGLAFGYEAFVCWLEEEKRNAN